jgi:hypothetical protein
MRNVLKIGLFAAATLTTRTTLALDWSILSALSWALLVEPSNQNHQAKATDEHQIAIRFGNADECIWRRLAERQAAGHGDHHANAYAYRKTALNASGERLHLPFLPRLKITLFAAGFN